MGLRVISVDGMLIRRTYSKILRCYGCGKYVLSMFNLYVSDTHVHANMDLWSLAQSRILVFGGKL